MHRTLTRSLLAAATAATLLLGGCSAGTSADGGTGATSPDAGSQASDTLDAAAFATVVDEPGVTLLDVRTPEEFAAGHLAGARNLDVSSPDFVARVAELPKDGRYAVYCRSGNRSAQALAAMREAGVTDAVHLDGGIGAWQDSGREVVTDQR